MLEEYNCLLLTSLRVSKFRYSSHVRKNKPLLNCTELLKNDDIKTFFRWQMHITVEFLTS